MKMSSRRIHPAGLTFRKKCLHDAWHRITVNAKGQLGLLNHTAESRFLEVAFQELGGAVCGCFELLYRWQRAIKYAHRSPLLPVALLPYYRDCLAKRQHRQKCREPVRGKESSTTPLFQRVRFLEQLLNRLLTTRLGMPSRQWISLSQAPWGWIPITLHRPCPVQNAREANMGVHRKWVEIISQRKLVIWQGGLTINIRRDQKAIAQLVPCEHPKEGLCLQKRWLPLL
jgi:hypothetical protein